MCLILGIYLWIKLGGKLLIVFQPFPHVVVSTRFGIWHGTDRNGSWQIEQMSNRAFSKWMIRNEENNQA